MPVRAQPGDAAASPGRGIAEAGELEDGRLRIWADSGADGAACRRCGQFSSRVHSQYQRRLADAPVGGRPVTLWLGVRRFFCRNDECKAVTFAEQFEGLTSPRARRTPPLARSLTAIGLALAGRAGTRLAAEMDLPATRTSMLRLVMALPDPAAGTVTILGIDDFAFRRGRDYGTRPTAHSPPDPGPPVTVRAVTCQPVDALLEAAADADMLVVGCRGAGGFKRLLTGSVSTQVAHHAACPVVHPADNT